MRAFSGFIHEHHGEPYWYRQEFYGKRDDGSRFVGVLFLCRRLPAELAPYRERFRSHSFGENEAPCVASGCVVPQTESSGDAFDLRGLTVGVSQFGFGNFAAAYREARPDGRTIAINPELPPYLIAGDGLVRAGCQEVLPDIARRLLG